MPVLGYEKDARCDSCGSWRPCVQFLPEGRGDAMLVCSCCVRDAVVQFERAGDRTISDRRDP